MPSVNASDAQGSASCVHGNNLPALHAVPDLAFPLVPRHQGLHTDHTRTGWLPHPAQRSGPQTRKAAYDIIQVEKAECFKETDKQMILDRVVKLYGSHDNFDTLLKLHLRLQPLSYRTDYTIRICVWACYRRPPLPATFQAERDWACSGGPYIHRYVWVSLSCYLDRRHLTSCIPGPRRSICASRARLFWAYILGPERLHVKRSKCRRAQ
jgi:hypothetical protein